MTEQYASGTPCVKVVFHKNEWVFSGPHRLKEAREQVLRIHADPDAHKPDYSIAF